MADLWDRLNNNSNEEPQVSGHYLPAILTSYHFGKNTAAQIKMFFNMDANAQADFDLLTTHLDGLATNIEKLGFLALVEAATVQIELGIITTKIQYATFLGII